MSKSNQIDDPVDDDYDEDADSDFDADNASAEGDESASSEDETKPEQRTQIHATKKQKTTQTTKPRIEELDSGDEATIQEQKKLHRKQRRKGEHVEGDSGGESEGWRAKTRAMRHQEKEEHKLNKLASLKASTIDVDKIWADMNNSGPLTPPQVEVQSSLNDEVQGEQRRHHGLQSTDDVANKENIPGAAEETITIKRTYRFAGEVHTEEKTVPKSSAEARLWLSQQASKPRTLDVEGKIVHRPLRKISRFDPNFTNLDAFKANWTIAAGDRKGAGGPKLNVVEKSKMDWAVHVDKEGLKEELDAHAKAKEGYLNRMDFLSEIEQRKEVEAREARLKK